MGRKWVHQQGQATLEDAIVRVNGSMPINVVIFRHLEQDGFKTVAIKELKLFMGIHLGQDDFGYPHSGYVVVLMDGSGQELKRDIWPNLELALDHYNSL